MGNTFSLYVSSKKFVKLSEKGDLTSVLGMKATGGLDKSVLVILQIEMFEQHSGGRAKL